MSARRLLALVAGLLALSAGRALVMGRAECALTGKRVLSMPPAAGRPVRALLSADLAASSKRIKSHLEELIAADLEEEDDMLGPQPHMPDYQSGFVSIVGNPNVGKSTLLNALLQQKLSIVSPKPQTTRQRILGILSGERYQMVFCDTPGMLRPAYPLQETMQSAVRYAVQPDEADAFLVVVDAVASVGETLLEDAQVLQRLQASAVPVIVAVNKADLCAPAAALDAWSRALPAAHLRAVSALRGDGVAALREDLRAGLPLGPKYYPSDQVSDRPERFFASEIIREALFHDLHEELPYGCAVVIDEFQDLPNLSRIQARVVVNRQAHKAMVIGAGGKMIQRIGQRARQALEQFLERRVHLNVRVDVDEGWRERPDALRRYGYLGAQ